MRASDIRTSFLEFFHERDHKRMPSSPLVLPDDPTLLFVNAGMNQFKNVFVGRESARAPRATTSQRCLRVSGKHNDLEMVGRTPRHHTFFEMLGNFSFGDYFKEDAIAWSWELLTEVWGIPAERLWVSVFGGSDAVGADDEAHSIWRDRIGVRDDRILRLGESENFWRMGDTGPCGPCSEIHYDLGESFTSVEGPANPETDDRRFLEVWNLVFMQFNQTGPTDYEPLPAPSIDTGMGLERISSVLQGVSTNFDTDLFVPLLDAAAAEAGIRRGEDPERDFSLRVIADHARALCFLVADGVLPANDNRGYVLRRLLRRAIRHGRNLGIEKPFLHQVTPVVIDMLGEAYPELVSARDAILEVGRREELRFAETLSTGMALLDDVLGGLDEKASGPAVLPGKDLFKLYDTYGFPLELARDIASERGVELDEEGFRAELERQRATARASWKGGARKESAPVYRELAARGTTEFTGYRDTRLAGARVVALLVDGEPVERLDGSGQVVLDKTPFYGESGGQVGDRGLLLGENARARVSDVTKPVAGLFVHDVQVERGVLEAGTELVAEVDPVLRAAIARNHTATHLVHAALRDVVGTHVKQAGSRVAGERLRFDFSHFAPLTDEVLADVEHFVHREVLADHPVETSEMDLEEALRLGAMALFGEKYGERVRVVRIGDSSLELCGGTHCGRSGEVGLAKLVSERGVASGVRRVEAVTGNGALDRFRNLQGIVRALEEQLSVPAEEIVAEVARRLDAARDLGRELERHRVSEVRDRLTAKAADPRRFGDAGVLAERVDGLSPQEMRELADGLRGKLRSGVVVLGRQDGEKVSVLACVTADLQDLVPARDLVRELGPLIGGGGGGRADLAEAGGKNPAGLDRALEEAMRIVEKRLEARS